VRTIKQPGRPARPRVMSMTATSGGELRVVVPEGADLLLGLARALGNIGVTSAAVFLNGGCFARMQYLTGQPCRDGKRVATYGAPTTLVGPVTLLSGNAFLGVDETGKAIVHCHAVVVDRDGQVHGGHLPPGVCSVGPGGVVALAAVLADATLAVRYDAETNYPIFHPTTPDEIRRETRKVAA
jgi:predicted DNA-binding protein with PD1-like motif